MDVSKLAQLARLDIPEEELKALEKELGAIVAYVSKIEEAKAEAEDGVSADLRSVMRDDADPFESGFFTDALIGNAPKQENGYLKVKKIL